MDIFNSILFAAIGFQCSAWCSSILGLTGDIQGPPLTFDLYTMLAKMSTRDLQLILQRIDPLASSDTSSLRGKIEPQLQPSASTMKASSPPKSKTNQTAASKDELNLPNMIIMKKLINRAIMWREQEVNLNFAGSVVLLPDKNVLFSPATMNMALTTLYLGAKGRVYFSTENMQITIHLW